MKKDIKGIIASAAMSVAIGLQFIFIKKTLNAFGGNIVNFMFARFALAILTLPLILPKNIKALLSDMRLGGLCLILPCANLLLQTAGTMACEVATVGYVSSLGPVITLAASAVINKEKLTAPNVIGMVCAFGGALLIGFGKENPGASFGWGALLILLALVARSLYSSLKAKGPFEYSAKEITFAQIFWGAAFYFILFVFFGNKTAFIDSLSLFKIRDTLSLLYTGLISLTLVYLLNNYSLSKISVALSGVASNLTFVVTVASGVAFLGEKISGLSVTGSIVIIIGVSVAAISPKAQ